MARTRSPTTREKADPPLDPPLIGGPNRTPPRYPPLGFQKVPSRGDVPRVGGGKTQRIPVGTRRIEAYRAGMDQHPDTWTAEGVKGGLIRFYRDPGRTIRSRSSSPAIPSSGFGRSRGSSSWRRQSSPWTLRPSSPTTCSGSVGRRERANIAALTAVAVHMRHASRGAGTDERSIAT
jgi:hypothetical protein